MRARALRAPSPTETAPAVSRASVARLLFLRGRDADTHLRQLSAGAAAALPVVGALARALVGRRLFEALGYRRLGDWSRERLGLGDRTVRDWARVWAGLEALPLLREAVCSGEVSFSVARLVVPLVTPETEAACLADVRGRTVRAVEAMVRAVREAEGRQPEPESGPEEEERALVRLACAPREAGMWAAGVELARQMAGESLPVWACAEQIAAEGAGQFGMADPEDEPKKQQRPLRSSSDADESGLRDEVWPQLRWQSLLRSLPGEIAALAENLDACAALEVDRRFRLALAFLQRIDLEMGRALRQVQRQQLHRELGFETFDRYVRERLDLAPRTARRLDALARAEHRAPAAATAFQEGRLTAFQASAVARVATVESAPRWVARAETVTLRRLEDDCEAEASTGTRRPGTISFRAPPDVAAFFQGVLRAAGSLERLLAHVIRAWVEQGEQFDDYADFERDGFRCTAPGCTSRRDLQSHHIWYRSHKGPDEPWNRTTLCWFHHHKGVHEGRMKLQGRAPDELIFELGGQRFRSGDVRLALGLPVRPQARPPCPRRDSPR